MATVKIRGRTDIIELDNIRAQTLKNRKFGLNGVERAEPLELVDLGEWAGEYGRIVEIIISKKSNQRTFLERKAEKEKSEEAKWMKLKPEVKAQRVGFFTVTYAMRLGDYGAQPPKALLKKVIVAQTKYFEENPKASQASVNCFEHLLPAKTKDSVSIATLTKNKNGKV